ncbi:DMP19 family protein, partial [Bacteroides heparinolyticus]
MIKVTDAALRQAAADGMDAFIHVFTEAYEQEMESNGNLAADTMSMLTAEQHSLLAYRIFRDEVMEGGFCQLIQNGYGGYIFDNPFAKVMRLWGIGDLSKLIYAAKKIYD